MTTSTLAAAFIEADASHRDGPNGPISRIVMHGTVSACIPGGARGNAHYFQDPDAGGAAHYVTDPGEIIGCVDEDVVAYHAPPNTGSIGVELCDWQNAPGHEGNLWGDQPHQQMLGLAARLVVDVADRRNVPKVWLSVQDLLDGAHGITSHANVAQAWHRTNHTDPGTDFPVDQFMALVTGATVPVPPHVEEDDVFICEFLDKPGFLWEVSPQPMPKVAGRADGDPYHRFGTREHVTDEPTFWRLAALGIPVRSGKFEGMELFAEIA